MLSRIHFLPCSPQQASVGIEHQNEDRGLIITGASDLTYIGHLEHLLIVQGLLCFHYTGKIYKFGRICRIGYMELSSTRV